jgi:hypothetical protein
MGLQSTPALCRPPSLAPLCRSRHSRRHAPQRRYHNPDRTPHQISALSTLPNQVLPEKQSAGKVYEKTKHGDGTRTCVAYLLVLASGAKTEYKGIRELVMQVRLDVSQWKGEGDDVGVLRCW